MAGREVDVFEVKGPNSKATGVFSEDGFLVHKGSTIRRDVVASAVDTVSPIRSRLIAEGVLVDQGGEIKFKTDFLFSSPSGAAAVVLGRTANGWIEWKNADGLTLSAVKRVSRESRDAILSPSQLAQIKAQYEDLLRDGRIPTREFLDSQYQLFRQKFGPDVLAQLKGEPLLRLMHDHRTKDCLVYWLEFKNDDEFNTLRFGSIAGGSALKFGIYRRKESGVWQRANEKGYESQNISEAEAVEVAEKHRDQLVLGARLLERLPESASDEEYAELQDQMDEQAPDVSRLAWGHKYFSLLFPTKLDDYHNVELQRFYLLKLLQVPPEGSGRYVCAGRFMAAAREAQLPITSLDTVISSLYGGKHAYWRIGTTNGSDDFWPMMQKEKCIAIGWAKVGDLSNLEASADGKEELRQKINGAYPNTNPEIGRQCSQVLQFVKEIAEKDIVVAADGSRIRGIGRVVGGYEFDSKSDFPHQRKVQWLNFDEWKFPEPKEGLQSVVRKLGKVNINIHAIEERLSSALPPNPPIEPGIRSADPLIGIQARIQSVLDRKKQVILYGPPGTGKTYWAERTALDLASLAAFGKLFSALSDSESRLVLGDADERGLVRICCFHPAYGYEDFLEGYRPEVTDGQVSFRLRDGVFKVLCADAQANPHRSYFLIIDEINRGDIPRIFGELLTVLEKDKRGKQVVLPVSQSRFSIPQNVFLIGTMNTADRSISLLDAALRRRFGFVELMPDSGVFRDTVIENLALQPWFDALNERIRQHVGRDARNLQIGHSFFMVDGHPVTDFKVFKKAVLDEIIPLLEEYCYEDFGSLSLILGEQFVDAQQQKIRIELFEDGQEDRLRDCFFAMFPEISTSTAVIQSESSKSPVEEDEEDSDIEGDDEVDS